MINLIFPVFQIFSDSTISKIENPEILKKMNKKYVNSQYWRKSIIVDSDNMVYELNELEIIGKKNHFNFYDLFYTTLEVNLVLGKLILDEVLLKKLEILFGNSWKKIVGNINLNTPSCLFKLLGKMHDLQLKNLG